MGDFQLWANPSGVACFHGFANSICGGVEQIRSINIPSSTDTKPSNGKVQQMEELYI